MNVYERLTADKWPRRRPLGVVYEVDGPTGLVTIRAYPGGRRLLVVNRDILSPRGTDMSTITTGSIVRVRTGTRGRPFQATVTKLYANGTDVGVKFNSTTGQDVFGTKQVRYGLDAVTLVG